jgi:hypothetical protein
MTVDKRLIRLDILVNIGIEKNDVFFVVILRRVWST